MFQFCWQHCFCSVDQEEKSFPYWFGWCGSEGPQHTREVFDPVSSSVLKLVKRLGFQSFEHLCIGSLYLTIASWI